MTTDQQILNAIQEGDQLIGYQKEIRQHLSENPRAIVVLDDDPTGTQTVQNIPVVTEWSETVLAQELQQSPVFFILTNSRSLQKEEAVALASTLGQRLKKLATKYSKNLLIISRSDSTLRGHYPDEVDALAKGMGVGLAKHVLIPAFFEGGRYTYNDIHYVREGDSFIPAAETPFAKDSTFGYKSSNLREYILEKHQASATMDQVACVSIALIRGPSISKISEHIGSKNNRYIAVNATSHADLEAFALASLRSNEDMLYRTAASFVNAITGKRPGPCLSKEEVLPLTSDSGALVVVGSYVPKTTAQLHHLKEHYDARFIELDVEELLSDTNLEITLSKRAGELDDLLEKGQNIVVYTSRKVVKGCSKEESLQIVNLVSKALTTLADGLKTQPRFILAKGGITSSDIAVKSLQIKRALVLGQLIKGVPVWRADDGSKFPDLPYIVFPGNVGSDADLYNALKKLE
ncbi:hypothetical protein FGM00_05275 [Aggregatimonas sangjinii]|uniref:Hydroxyacid dehydrogenase n=1 Tax=Aggregatimonas sangjinii TaxID=2583587 RepID=A0A5B7SM50_9FLAO|nr:four-carbon acid sugar kinase family protein [Aggregatimonas sangjinii]QCW99546.1 hypothetical protein FGM00_05275 [Aggregatimonas sangjinii]